MIITVMELRILLQAYLEVSFEIYWSSPEIHSFVLNLNSLVRISIPIRTVACPQHDAQIVRQFIQSANTEFYF
jgi:hypothetical protein